MADLWCRTCDHRFSAEAGPCPRCGDTEGLQRVVKPPERGRRFAGGFVVGAGIAGLLTVPGELFDFDVAALPVRIVVCVLAGLLLGAWAARGR